MPNCQPDDGENDGGKNSESDNDQNSENDDGQNGRNDESGALTAGEDPADVNVHADADENEAQPLLENEGTGNNNPWSPFPPPWIHSPCPSPIQKHRHSAILSGTTSATSTVLKKA